MRATRALSKANKIHEFSSYGNEQWVEKVSSPANDQAFTFAITVTSLRDLASLFRRTLNKVWKPTT